LGWWQKTQFITTPVRLVDISVNGCLAESRCVPQLTARQPVWVHPCGMLQAEWTEGQVVRVRKRFLGRCQIRVIFPVPLAYDLFKRLVFVTNCLPPSV